MDKLSGMDLTPQWPLKNETPPNVPGDKAPWYRLESMPETFAAGYAQLSQPWQPGFWKRFPVRGLGMWLLALVGTVAAILILIYSDGVPVDHWDEQIQPTVWLALTSALTGAFLACAFAEAAAISYWRAAGRPTTVRHKYV